MKRRIETQIKWNFNQYGSKKGLPTDLPLPLGSKEPLPVCLKEVSVLSSQNSTEGRIDVELDRYYGSDYRGNCPLEAAIRVLYHKLYENHVITGPMLGGGYGFSFEFELSRREKSFCHKAIYCIVWMIQELGLQRSEIFYPEVSQKTFVWIPKARAPFVDPNFWGWIEYGKWLGSQCRLKDRFSDKQLPELKNSTSLI